MAFHQQDKQPMPAADRLVSRGYGESNPVADNTTEVGKAKNQRVELKRLD
jgi:OOP family OmpA-OmpF porin